jgi:hypothetical protein
MLQVIEYVQHTSAAAWCKLDSAPCHVQHPTKDLLPLTPPSLAFVQLLDRYRFLPSEGCVIRSQEHFVNRVHNAPADFPTSPMGALRHPNEVIDKDVDMSNGASMLEERSTVLRLRQRAKCGCIRLDGGRAEGGQRTHERGDSTVGGLGAVGGPGDGDGGDSQQSWTAAASSSLCSGTVWRKRAALARSAAVSDAVQKVGAKIPSPL